MAFSCQVIPVIKNPQGKWVQSNLFKELLDIFQDRELVKKIYYGTHTDYFLNWFGDWINNPEKASLVVDENGEPRIVQVLLGKAETPTYAFVKMSDQSVFAEFEQQGGKEISGLSKDMWMDLTEEVQVEQQDFYRMHPDERVSAALLKHGRLVINALNNPLVWDEEDKLGLIDKANPWRTNKFGKPERRKLTFTHAKAKRLEKQAKDDGFNAFVKPVETKGRLSKYVVVLSKEILQEASAIERKNFLEDLFKKAQQEAAEFHKTPAGEAVMNEMGRSHLTDVEKLHDKARKALDKRLELMRSSYTFIQRQDFQDFYQEFTSTIKPTEALISMILYAGKVTKALWDRYEKMKENNVPLTANVLRTWTDFLIAYETLDEIQGLLLDDPSLINDPKVIGVLNWSIVRKNKLKDLYKTKGVELLAKWLSPYYNGIREQVKETARAEYRKQYYREKRAGKQSEDIKKRLGTQEEYAERELERQRADVEKNTEDLLKDELAVAGRDVGYLTRWIDNMLDTSDPVAAAVVKAFTQAEEQARLESLKKRIDILRKVRDFEQTSGRRLLSAPIEIYKQFLEFDEDNSPTGYLKMPWKSALMEEEKRQWEKIYKQGSPENDEAVQEARVKLKKGQITKEQYYRILRTESNKKMRAWRDAFLRVDNDLLTDALLDYVDSATKIIDPVTNEPLISKTEATVLRNYEELGTYNIRFLVERNEISEETADLVTAWRNDNRWKFSNVVEEWRNPEWDVFMKKVGIRTDIPFYFQEKELAKSGHVDAKFYTFISELAKEADSKVPYGYRLGYRLPGVPKVGSERLKEGQDISIAVGEKIKMDIILRTEDTERGNVVLTDELGNPRMFLPIHYVNKLDPKTQSYDLPTIYFKFWESANDYNIKRQILPELEMARELVKIRRAIKRDSLGRIIKSKVKRITGNIDDEVDKPTEKDKTFLAEQLNDWFEMAVYGKKSLPGSLYHISEDVVIDGAKLTDAVNRYTSLSLLALNMVQGVANVAIGEVMQAIDAFAHEHVNAKSLSLATAKYSKWLPGMLGDVGSRAPEHVGSLLIEWANILHDDATNVNFSKMTKIGQIMNTSTMFWLQQAGEHWMQSRFFFALLAEKKAYDKDGNLLGNMLDMYEKGDKEYKDELEKKHGKKWSDFYIPELRLHSKVDIKKSEWNEIDQIDFMVRARGLLSRLHGEYSDLGRVALQRMAIGRMAYMFRKFVVPGFKRRWGRRQYIQRIDQFTEGNYVTTLKFLNNLRKDLKIFKLAMMSEEWAMLSNHEKANIRRTLGEVMALVSAVTLANFAFRNINDDDDEDDDRIWAYWAYQAYRLRAELLFFTPKIDEAMSILRSPMASISSIDNLIDLISQMFQPGERYERGPWKDQLKLTKEFVDMVPLVKQFYKLRDVEQQISWFKK